MTLPFQRQPGWFDDLLRRPVHLLDSSADAPGEVGQVVVRQGEDAAVPEKAAN